MGLSNWGWDARWEAACAAAGTPGRVIYENRGHCRVITELGEIDVIPPSQPALAPVTGDWVLLDSQSGRLVDRLPRRNQLSRKKAGREFAEQVLAANVDVLFLVMGLDGDFNPRRIERFLLLAHSSRVDAVIVLNKRDLCADPFARLDEVDRLTSGLTPALLLSALEPGSVLALHRYMEPCRTAVLLGSSGAGKSTIVNALLGAEVQPTRDVRTGDARGRHTTTSRHLFRLDAGWLLMDTPGLRELEPWADVEGVGAVFPEIAELAAGCRFRDCIHTAEPGCAVLAAIAEGTLPPERLASYHKLGAEQRHLERMQDARAAAELKRQWKVIHRAMRHMPDKRR